MEPLEMTGKTVEEAVEKALRQLDAGLEDVEVVVVDKGRSGVFGLGAEDARVRVTLKLEAPDVFDTAKETIEGLLGAMGVAAAVVLPEISQRAAMPAAPPLLPPPSPEGEGEMPEAEPIFLTFDIEGEDAGLLIGRGGETLSSLQFLVNFIVSRKTGEKVMINIDVEGYRERHAERLRSQAMHLADRAVQTGRIFAMDPMPARDRRLVHMALAGDTRVRTESVGEGEDRKITIIPKREGRPPPPPRGPREYLGQQPRDQQPRDPDERHRSSRDQRTGVPFQSGTRFPQA